MVEQKTGGSIVCIASTASHKSLAPQTIAAYTASKFAVRGLAKQVAHEMAKYDVRVNSISPGCTYSSHTQHWRSMLTSRQNYLDGHAERGYGTESE
jgi:NAD(P)-dependent dehydrogenase (short-subunit alcohol dehydrogenase family)